MQSFELIATLLIPIAIIGVALALAAWASAHFQALVRLAFAKVGTGLQYLSDGLGKPAVLLTDGVRTVRHDLTHGGTASLPKVIVAVLILSLLVAVLVTIDLLLWSQFFAAQSPEILELPVIGEVSAGLFRAFLPVTAALLTGYLVEGLLGLIPLPLARADLEPGVRRRTRGALWVVALALWCVLVANAIDMATAIHTELGRNHCARLALDEVQTDTGPSTAFDDFGLAASAPASTAPGSGSASTAATQAACLTDWRADSVGRSMQIVQAELALNLTGLFAWVVFAAGSVVGLLVLALALSVVRTAQFAIGFVARAMVPIGEFVVSLLQLPKSLFDLLLGTLRRRDVDGGSADHRLPRGIGNLIARQRLRERRHARRAGLLSIDALARKASPPTRGRSLDPTSL